MFLKELVEEHFCPGPLQPDSHVRSAFPFREDPDVACRRLFVTDVDLQLSFIFEPAVYHVILKRSYDSRRPGSDDCYIVSVHAASLLWVRRVWRILSVRCDGKGVCSGHGTRLGCIRIIKVLPRKGGRWGRISSFYLLVYS